MAIPKLHDVTLPLMPKLAAAGGELPHSILVEQLAEHFKLTEVERELRHTKGGHKVFRNSRIGYAKLELKLAGFIVYSKGGPVRLTEVGRKVLRDNPRRIDKSFLTPWQEDFAKQKKSERDFGAGLRESIPQDSVLEKFWESEDWTEGENHAIVRDYFAMLKNEQTEQPFSKAEHRRALVETTGRSHGSIEFKHCNISAVMEALGLPRIEGYRPRGNFQKSLIEIVEAHFKKEPDLYKLLTGEVGVLRDSSDWFKAGETIVVDEAPPKRGRQEQSVSEEINSIVRKFESPAERDARNRNLGKAGESLVYEHERRRLQLLGRKDLSESVRWVARDDGDGYGFDILSFSGKGDVASQELWLEVKTTNGSASTPFYLTWNELRVSKERPDAFRIFRLYDFRLQARAFCLAPPLDKELTLTPTIFRASF